MSFLPSPLKSAMAPVLSCAATDPLLFNWLKKAGDPAVNSAGAVRSSSRSTATRTNDFRAARGTPGGRDGRENLRVMSPGPPNAEQDRTMGSHHNERRCAGRGRIGSKRYESVGTTGRCGQGSHGYQPMSMGDTDLRCSSPGRGVSKMRVDSAERETIRTANEPVSRPGPPLPERRIPPPFRPAHRAAASTRVALSEMSVR